MPMRRAASRIDRPSCSRRRRRIPQSPVDEGESVETVTNVQYNEQCRICRTTSARTYLVGNCLPREEAKAEQVSKADAQGPSAGAVPGRRYAQPSSNRTAACVPK